MNLSHGIAPPIGRPLRCVLPIAFGAALALWGGPATRASALAAESESASTPWFLEAARVPTGLRPAEGAPLVVVAIVDDGVQISHPDLTDLLWTHAGEIPGNRIDDDGNGHIDDLLGWDVSDDDATVAPPAGRLAEFPHGTHLAGILAQIVRHAYGNAAPERLAIMPVKALADDAASTYLFDGYSGIEYAIETGADVILAAWGSNAISDREAAVLARAREKGVLVIASAGNFDQGRSQYPAAAQGVLAVAGLDRQGRKLEQSNFGSFVDLSAPSELIASSDVRSVGTAIERTGTSQAAAIVAAGAVLVASQHPDYSAEQIEACLLQGARPVDADNPRYGGQLGAGALDLLAAVGCEVLAGRGSAQQHLSHPVGFLHLTGEGRETRSWTIAPQAEATGVRFRVRSRDRRSGEETLSFYAGPTVDARTVGSWALSELPESVFVPGNVAHVVLAPTNLEEPLDWLVEYRTEAVDQRTRFCTGTVTLTEPGSLTDGSGPEPYSYDTVCQWLITAPEDKRIEVRFTALDTEPNTDSIHVFDGARTNGDLIAVISGSRLPPAFTSWSNQMLLWFLSDGDRQGQGWALEYRFVDP